MVLSQIYSLYNYFFTTDETFRSFFDEKDKKMYEQLKKECELVLLNNR